MRHVTHYLRGAPQGIEAMKRGPKPIGETAMTHAERQARYRATHARAAAPKIKYRKPADRRSRPQRWRDAVAELVELQGRLSGVARRAAAKSGGRRAGGGAARDLRLRPFGA